MLKSWFKSHHLILVALFFVLFCCHKSRAQMMAPQHNQIQKAHPAIEIGDPPPDCSDGTSCQCDDDPIYCDPSSGGPPPGGGGGGGSSTPVLTGVAPQPIILGTQGTLTKQFRALD
jgi:hypothetical protein